MELDIFISESLKSIIKGIDDVKGFALENGAVINPSVEGSLLKTEGNIENHAFLKGIEGAKHISNINFDIAVTVSSQQNSDIGGKINVLALSLGSKINDVETNQTVSRLQFSIKAMLPGTNTYMEKFDKEKF